MTSTRFRREIGRFRLDRFIIFVLIVGAVLVGGKAWLARHPEHDPWAPLDLRDPPGWATQDKLVALRGDPASCAAVLDRSEIAYDRLEPAGEGACRRADRIALTETVGFSPARPDATCAVQAAMALWVRQSLQPAAEEQLGSPVARIEHYGTFSCRRLYGADEGAWSEHATANAIDLAAFVLEDGRRVSVLSDWNADDESAAFLRRIRDEACPVFGTVLSPDYNDAHRDHLHFDQAARNWTFCR